MEHDGIATVVGCGGAGVNFVFRSGPKCEGWAKVYAVEADAKHLITVKVTNSLLMGPKTLGGMGAGRDYTLAEMGAKESRPDFLKMVNGSKTVFVVVGLAGTTGTAAAVLISRLAKESGARAVAFGILPFAEEGPEADFNARHGLAKLQSACDAVVVAKNEQLLGMHPKMDFGKAFKLMDEAIVGEVRHILNTKTALPEDNMGTAIELDLSVSSGNKVKSNQSQRLSHTGYNESHRTGRRDNPEGDTPPRVLDRQRGSNVGSP